MVDGSSDSYVVITYSGRKLRSKVCSDQGSNPYWNQHFYFPIREENTPISPISRQAGMSPESSPDMIMNSIYSCKLEPDTLEFKVFNNDNLIGSVREEILPSTLPYLYSEMRPFAVFHGQEVDENMVISGELWMEIGFQVEDEPEFHISWPGVDENMYEFKRRTFEETVALETELTISGLKAQNEELDPEVARLERPTSALTSSSFWQTLCCCFGSSRHPQDKEEDVTPLTASTIDLLFSKGFDDSFRKRSAMHRERLKDRKRVGPSSGAFEPPTVHFADSHYLWYKVVNAYQPEQVQSLISVWDILKAFDLEESTKLLSCSCIYHQHWRVDRGWYDERGVMNGGREEVGAKLEVE
ncbi:hypothetical protein R1sor_021539 [Riccia sorocarpa]|uniref:C2 domain-containing protein n=1 Tax=Riccia sorocarpa TaxID=122646 RepID=A0ABD3GHC6_9MARC